MICTFFAACYKQTMANNSFGDLFLCPRERWVVVIFVRQPVLVLVGRRFLKGCWLPGIHI